MELLINELMKLGADRTRFVAKAFGGANVITQANLPPIGAMNAKFVRMFLATERIPLVAERLGGHHAVHVYFWTATGKAMVNTVDGSKMQRVVAEERRFRKTESKETCAGDITLF